MAENIQLLIGQIQTKPLTLKTPSLAEMVHGNSSNEIK